MTVQSWTPSDAHETLLTLYLRLNGFFTTGLVVHHPERGRARTEIDCLAVRHPWHAQPEREVPCAPFLAPAPGIVDLLICEAKSAAKDVAFNAALKNDAAAAADVLRWSGLFSEHTLPAVSARVRDLLQDNVGLEQARNGIRADNVRVRGLLCCPPVATADVPDRWCLVGAEILDFASRCFNPPEPRCTCSTRYNFLNWGRELAPLVQYFKGLEPGERPSLERLYRYLES
jgi:hypothetical protein